MTGNRISVRLSDAQIERLKLSCGEANNNISDVVRKALGVFLSPDAGAAPITGAPSRLYPPEEILKAIPKYLAWGSGDARMELQRLFSELLACSFALKRTFPRTQGIKALYEALRPLCPFFGMDNV